MRVSTTLLAGAASAALVASLAAVPAQAKGGEPEVVTSGLAGPLSLAVGEGHDVYVSQSGAGVLSKVDRRGTVRTITSIDDLETQSMGGVAWHRGATYHLEGDFSGEMPVTHVVRTDRKGARTVVSDNFWEYEMTVNPDAGQSYGFVGLDEEDEDCAGELAAFEGAFPEEFRGLPFLSEYTGIVESNAYQLTVDKRGAIYVADAAANAVLKVDRSGTISTVAVIPSSPITFTDELEEAYEGFLVGAGLPDTDVPGCVVGHAFTPEPVPTDVQVGHKGALLVSTLQGSAGEIMPLSKVYRVTASSGSATEVAGGMHGATGLAVTASGQIFVAELFGGEVSVIRPGSNTARTAFTAPMPADVDVRGSFVYATTDVFGEGNLVRHHHPMGR